VRQQLEVLIVSLVIARFSHGPTNVILHSESGVYIICKACHMFISPGIFYKLYYLVDYIFDVESHFTIGFYHELFIK
jgi:hypothetical protein